MKNSKLQTKKVDSKSDSSTGFASYPTWNQKFVFAIPHTFITNDNKISSVWFEIFRVRKGFPDQSFGKAEGKLHLEKTTNEEENTNDRNDVCYDSETENDNFYSVEEEEEEKEKEKEEEACELKGTGSVKVEGGELKVEMVVWKGFLSRVGDCKWRRWAMEYDEFMGLDQGSVNKNKKKISALFTCFSKPVVV
ncbi:hypothetical protein Vadar_021411 [Vaccinium darrowii]|uniref:Uncharacterized protein n=1 Tax=Vaccinium darrowii TaxID=229202 RepID=A0ACB7ZCQ0_9ERIC|nr:hypothetical protein Vadar_021411 [Vaccinium darrowii]